MTTDLYRIREALRLIDTVTRSNVQDAVDRGVHGAFMELEPWSIAHPKRIVAVEGTHGLNRMRVYALGKPYYLEFDPTYDEWTFVRMNADAGPVGDISTFFEGTCASERLRPLSTVMRAIDGLSGDFRQEPFECLFRGEHMPWSWYKQLRRDPCKLPSHTA